MICERMFRLKKNGLPYSDCYCRNPELIENYDKAIADTTQTWEVHHMLECCFTQKFLKEMGLYYDVEPEALVFLTPSEHSKIDSCCKRRSEALKRKEVICIETGEIFASIHDASRITGIPHGNISKACNGKLNTTGGHHWKLVDGTGYWY